MFYLPSSFRYIVLELILVLKVVAIIFGFMYIASLEYRVSYTWLGSSYAINLLVNLNCIYYLSVYK